MQISGNIVDVTRKEIYYGSFEIKSGRISRLTKISSEKKNKYYLMPGFVNSHIHIESTMLSPAEYARCVIRFGSVAAICDPHEIANVLGVYGIDFMIENGKNVPFKFYYGVPSCVPATEYETSGFELNAEVIKSLLKNDDISFLAEVMNYPAVLNNDKEIYEKINAAHHYKKPVDGHAPGLSGKDLYKYSNAGITTDHECFSYDEALEKIKAGIKIQIREGSAAKNFNALYKLIDQFPDEVMICTDDSHPDDLQKGHLNIILKQGINKNLNIFNLLKTVTVNPIKHYNLNVGLLNEGDPADFIEVDNLKELNVTKTYIRGKLLFNGKKVFFPESKMLSINNFNRSKISDKDIQLSSNEKFTSTIGVIDGELITKHFMFKLNKINNYLQPDITNDVLKIVIANRYNDAKPSVGFIHNFGLIRGAIASTIAHDSHNIIAVGVSDEMIVKAINRLVETKGGIVACDETEIVELSLEIAGLMTNEKIEVVSQKYISINKKAKELGSQLKAPFMTLSFMSLLVIPELKLSDKGLFDVTKFKFI
ncbi:MAG: adenine deaminase [Bacteroidota bacterium]